MPPTTNKHRFRKELAVRNFIKIMAPENNEKFIYRSATMTVLGSLARQFKGKPTGLEAKKLLKEMAVRYGDISDIQRSLSKLVKHEEMQELIRKEAEHNQLFISVKCRYINVNIPIPATAPQRPLRQEEAILEKWGMARDVKNETEKMHTIIDAMFTPNQQMAKEQFVKNIKERYNLPNDDGH